MKKQRGFTVVELLIVITMLYGAVSWGKNAYNLTQCDFDPIGKAEFVYTLGIFTPTFLVTAWVSFED